MPDTPRIYDISLDEYRPATQRDINLYMELGKSWGRVVEESRQAPGPGLAMLIEDEVERLKEIYRANSAAS